MLGGRDCEEPDRRAVDSSVIILYLEGNRNQPVGSI